MNASSFATIQVIDRNSLPQHASAAVASTVEPLSWPRAAGVILLLSGVLWAMILRLVLSYL